MLAALALEELADQLVRLKSANFILSGNMQRRSLHPIPKGNGAKLDLNQPPARKEAAAGYAELVDLLESLARQLDKEGIISVSRLRAWEGRVLAHLLDREIDMFVSRPEEDDTFDSSGLAEHRWQNLRRILLRRKGVRS